jgi:hypothetical protein
MAEEVSVIFSAHRATVSRDLLAQKNARAKDDAALTAWARAAGNRTVSLGPPTSQVQGAIRTRDAGKSTRAIKQRSLQ